MFRLDRFTIIADDAADLLASVVVIGAVRIRLLLLPLVAAFRLAATAATTAAAATARIIVGRRNVAERRAGPAGQPGQGVPRRRRLPVRESRPAGRLLRPGHVGS